MRLFLESFRLEWGRNFYPESQKQHESLKQKSKTIDNDVDLKGFGVLNISKTSYLVSGTFPSWWIIFLAPLLQAAANACRADRVDHLQVSPGFRFTSWISNNHWSNTVDGSEIRHPSVRYGCLSLDLRCFNAHPTGGCLEFPGKSTSFSRRPNLSSKPRVKKNEDAWMETFTDQLNQDWYSNKHPYQKHNSNEDAISLHDLQAEGVIITMHWYMHLFMS